MYFFLSLREIKNICMAWELVLHICIEIYANKMNKSTFQSIKYAFFFFSFMALEG